MNEPSLQLQRFFELAHERKLCGSDQLMYLHLLNMSYRAERLLVSDSELKGLMRLYDLNGKPSSAEVLRRGRQRLKAKGFLDFTEGKGIYPTEYFLHNFNPAGSPTYSPAGSAGDKSRHLAIPRSSPLLYQPQPEKEKEKEKRGHTYELLDLLKSPRGGNNITKVNDEEPLGEQDEDVRRVVEMWNNSKVFPPLDHSLTQELRRLLNEYGVTTILETMEKVRQSQRTGVNFNYFRRCLEDTHHEPNYNNAKYARMFGLHR